MLNSVILTVQIAEIDFEYDMELPANMPGRLLCDKLLSALKNIETDAFHMTETINLLIEHTQKVLEDDKTLEESGVWDGSIITVLKGR